MAVGQASEGLVHASPEKCRKSQGLSERLRAIAKNNSNTDKVVQICMNQKSIE